MSPPKFCGAYNGDDEYDEDDDDCEMVALMPPTDEEQRERRNSWGSVCSSEEESSSSSMEELRNRSKLRRRQLRSSLRHYLIRGNDDNGVGAYRCGLILVLIASLMLIRWWVDDDQSSSSGDVHCWKNLCLKDIKHWCLDPNSHSCENQCVNPLQPKPRNGHKTWELAHDGNIRDAYDMATTSDVVFLGDSIIEGWRGMSFGLPIQHKQENLHVFNKLFHSSSSEVLPRSNNNTSDFEGLALGIAGDRTSNLLWRIQNGEVPKELQPSVWWILIGTNDFLREDHCSPEVVLMGIKRVVEEIRQRKPGSKIVVNGLLPRSESLDGSLGVAANDDNPQQKEQTIWNAIQTVNAGLKEYCHKYKTVMYYDASQIFIRRKDEGQSWEDASNLYIPQDLMNDYLHPTAAGYQKWGEEIVSALHMILDASQSEEGRKPLPPISLLFGNDDKKPDLSKIPSRQQDNPSNVGGNHKQLLLR